MKWNYRILATRTTVPGDDPEYSFEIHRVYYDGDESVAGVSSTSVVAFGDSLENLRKDLHLMLGAFDKPVLSFERFPEEHTKDLDIFNPPSDDDSDN